MLQPASYAPKQPTTFLFFHLSAFISNLLQVFPRENENHMQELFVTAFTTGGDGRDRGREKSDGRHRPTTDASAAAQWTQHKVL